MYNSTQSVEELVGRVITVFQEKVRQPFEIILVDDGSPNVETWPVLERLSRAHEEVRAFLLTKNFGKQGAVLCGFEHAHGQYIFTLDDDLQHLPEDIPAFIPYQEHDVVIGVSDHKRHSFFKRFASNLKARFDEKLIGKPRGLKLGPFKLFKREVVQHLLQIKTTYPLIGAMMFMVTKDIVNVSIGHEKRKYGKSGFTIGRMFKQFSNLLFNHSYVLLRWVAVFGILLSILSFLLAIFYAFKKVFIGVQVSGWTSIIVVLLLSTGIILFSMGIIGEYLLRIIKNVEGTPPYFVRTIATKPEEEQV